MRSLLGHVVKWLEDSAVEHFEVSIEDAKDLADRSHVEEDVYWSVEDFGQSFFVHIATDVSLLLVVNEVASQSQSQEAIADEDQVLHVAQIVFELSFSWRVGPILDYALFVDLAVLEDDGRGDNESNSLKSGHLEKLVVSTTAGGDLFVVLIEKEFANEVARIFVEFSFGTFERFQGLLDFLISEDYSFAFLLLALLNLFLVLFLVCA